MITNVSHIGVMVKDLEQAIESYTHGLGVVLEKRMENPDLKLRIGILRIGSLEIELLEFKDPELPIPKAIRANKAGLSHLCFEVTHLDQTIKELEAKGFQLLEGFPRQGAHGRIAFMSPPHAPEERIELLEVEE
ncbi:MAG TPA: VOC family protein [Thermodesulfobacteriota bacterium]|nr:VOC family protein [Thermodesulfobacteriota bacterium]